MPVGDVIEFRMDAAAFRAAIGYREVRMDKAAKWILREMGRTVWRTARPATPVLTGRLRRSIKSSRVMGGNGASGYRLTVAPRGWPARGYAGKIEARAGYMATGRAAAEAATASIAERAWAGVWMGRL